MVGREVAHPGSVSLSVLGLSDTLLLAVGVVWLLTYLATGVVFILWLWRARANTEIYHPYGHHQRHRLWVIFGWFVPGVNFWFPYQIVRDTWDSSLPTTPDSGRPDRTFRLITLWWLVWVAFVVADRIYARLPVETLEQVGTDAQFLVVNESILIAAAVLAIFVVRRVTALQAARFAEFVRGVPYGTTRG